MLAAYEEGVNIFDVSAGGLGGGPFVKGASGNVAAEDAVNLLGKTGLPRRTAATITDRNRLLKELENVRGQGCAISIGERAADICAMAAPVLDHGHELVGALSISGPISRFTPPVRKSYAQLLLAAALQLSRQLGCEAGRKSQGQAAAG